MTRLRELQATTRRRYAKAFKADIVAQCQMAGASVARIARSHDLNANMVHRWIRELTGQMPIVPDNPSTTPAFVALPLPTAASAASGAPIEIKMPHASGTIVVHCPAEQASACAFLLKEWLA